MRLTVTSVALAAWAAWGSAVPAAESEPRSVQSGVYTKDQAEAGREIFKQVCMTCHQAEEFSSAGYMESWSGTTVSDFIGLVRSTMPQDSPGRLKQSEYIAIAAFLLELNGVPSGETEMDGKALKDIKIEGPFTAKED